MTARLSRSPRDDARENHERIIHAARSALGAQGLDVPIREIARRAGTGTSTVYRHFPTKQLLVAEVFADDLRAWRSALDDGLADPDPWRGFCRTVARLCDLQARDNGFAAAVKARFPRALDLTANRASSLASAAELVRRAKATGRLRTDVTVNDVTLMLMAGGGIRANTPAARVAASRRFAALTIRAFRAPSAP
ncbi:TetR/AcrR family transcriptional regulator [Cryptosporangium phraense]|uniref:TetR/AcrR family transcriptional regulator n=1 Tax=Cryptosporangium phraense TaxID=2593070 RepID=UPI00197B01CD|nr:TetR/AcrR family transcriptional regulator [Cryptosporangium phraense]